MVLDLPATKPQLIAPTCCFFNKGSILESHKASKTVAKNEPVNPFKKLAKPAQRALAGAGITTLKQLAKLTEEALSSLHGIGANAVEKLKQELMENELSFAGKK